MDIWKVGEAGMVKYKARPRRQVVKPGDCKPPIAGSNPAAVSISFSVLRRLEGLVQLSGWRNHIHCHTKLKV